MENFSGRVRTVFLFVLLVELGNALEVEPPSTLSLAKSAFDTHRVSHGTHPQHQQHNVQRHPRQRLKASVSSKSSNGGVFQDFEHAFPQLHTNGTCLPLPPDLLDNEHALFKPVHKVHQRRYCNHEDVGTCGHACCTVQVVSPKGCDTKCAFSRITSVLNRGNGPDHRFRLLNASDLRSLEGAYRHNIEFMIDIEHKTEHYGHRQILQFQISPMSSMGEEAFIRGFSISIGDESLRDFGQNYKNMAYLIQSSFDRALAKTIAITHGCGRSGLIQNQGSVFIAVGTGVLGLVIGIIATFGLLSCMGCEQHNNGNNGKLN